MSTIDGKTPFGSINEQQARDWTKAWQIANPNLPKAFLIPNSSLLSILEEIGVLVPDGNGGFTVESESKAYGVRAYMAIGPDAETGKNENKLVMVGTVEIDGEYQDQVEGTKNPLQVSLIGSGAFDMTRPCPRICDTNSPLYYEPAIDD
jgi:hypothetical protein